MGETCPLITLVWAIMPSIPRMTRSGIASSKLFSLFLDAEGFGGIPRLGLWLSHSHPCGCVCLWIVCLLFYSHLNLCIFLGFFFAFLFPQRPLLFSSHSDSEEIDRKRARVKNSEGGDVPQKYFVVTNNQLLRVKYLLVYSQKQHRR